MPLPVMEQQLRSSASPVVGIVGGSPVSVEGVRRALISVGVKRMTTIDYYFAGSPPIEDLASVVLFANAPERLDAIRALRGKSADLPVIALIADPVTCHDALVAEASSVARWDSPVEEIARVVESCLLGRPVVPTDLVRELIDLLAVPEPNAEESFLLFLLAEGGSMRTVAERLGYSERHLYRVLKRLYERLGVTTKDAAVDLAVRRGWLRSTPPASGGETITG